MYTAFSSGASPLMLTPAARSVMPDCLVRGSTCSLVHMHSTGTASCRRYVGTTLSMPTIAMVTVAQVRVLLEESERAELDRLVSILMSGSGRAGGGEGGDTIARETWNDVKVH